MNRIDPQYDAHEALLAEHAELTRLLDQVNQALDERKATIGEVCDLLARLGDRLVKHFAMEEDGGYFVEAISHAPQLIAKANQLLAQHPKMCCQAQGLSADLNRSGASDSDWWEETRRRFCALRDELLRHERHENRLLQEAYTQDLGAND